MKKIVAIALFTAAFLIGAPYLVLGQSGGFAPVWIPSGGNVQLFDSTYGVRIQSLGSTGSPCVSVSSTGVLSTTTCGTGGGPGAVYLASSSPWTVGNAAFVTGQGTVGSVATGTLTDNITGLSFDATRGLFGGSALLSLDAGYSIPLTNSLLTANSSTTGNLAFWSGNQTLGNVATGTLTEGVTGLEFTATRALIGGAAALNLTTGFVIPTSTLWTNVADFYQTPSTRITAGANCSWVGNTFNCTSVGGGGLSTTTDIIGDGGDQLVSYQTGDVIFGGVSSTTAEFQFDDDGGKFIIASSSAQATTTLANVNDANAIQFGIASTSGSALVRGLHWAFRNGTQAVVSAVGTITDIVFQTAVQIAGALKDGTGSAGTNGMVLQTTGTGVQWVATSSLGISGGPGGPGTVYLATTSPWTTGDLAFANGNGAVSSVATGTLTEGVTGLELTATRGLVGGSAVLNLTSGFVIPTSSLWTSVADFYQTPSTRITAGTGLSWSGNTLNSAGWLSTTSPWTVGNAAFVASNGAVGSVATGTLTDNITGLSFNNQTRGLFGGSAQLALDTGYTIPTTDSLITANSSTTGNLAFWSGNQTLGNVATGTLSEGINGLEFSATRALIGGSAALNLTAGFVIPSTTLITAMSAFNASPSSRCVEITGSADLCDGVDGGGGGGGGALSTTTDIVGDGPASTVSYVTGDVMFGGSSSTTAEFQFDVDGGKLIIASTTAAATTTLANVNPTNAVQFGIASTTGAAAVRAVHYDFASSVQVVLNLIGGMVDYVLRVARVIIEGNLAVIGSSMFATTTYNGATTSDAVVVDGYTNSGEWIAEFCTTPWGETTQIATDGLKGCNRWSYYEDANGVIDFATTNDVATTVTQYFRIRPGATGATSVAGDGMGIAMVGGPQFATLWRSQPALEWTMRQDALNNATATIIMAGFLTSPSGLAGDLASEPSAGLYVIATSTANWLLACNPETGGTTYVNTGVATSTRPLGNSNNFGHWRMEISGTASTSVTALVKYRTATTTMAQVANCTISTAGSTSGAAPTISISKTAAGQSPELHVQWIKLWHRARLF